MKPRGLDLPNSPWHPGGHSTDVTNTKDLVGVRGGSLHGDGTARLPWMGQWGAAGWTLSSVTLELEQSCLWEGMELVAGGNSKRGEE